jgi:hypothetical protein
MKVNWVTNSRVKDMAAQGIINDEDIVPRGSTANYLADTATVNMKDVAAPKPWVTIHIRGAEHKQPRLTRWIAATTMRVTFGQEYRNKSLSGELSQELDFGVVDRVVKQVETAMEG